MANQYTKKEVMGVEINEIISLYVSGMSFSNIGIKLNRKKDNIKKILIDNGVWVEGRDKLKKEFTPLEIDDIRHLYINEGLSCNKIGIKFGLSNTPIKELLRSLGVLRKTNSNGIKIMLTEEQKETIKQLYVEEYNSAKEICEKVNLSKAFIDKYLHSVSYRRTKSEGASIGGVKKYSNISYDEYIINLPIYKKYRKMIISITNKQPLKTLSNYEKRGDYRKIDSYHLDHKYSISEGFKNNIKPEIIANINNLEFIPWKDNLIKKNKCSITITQLTKNL